MNSRYPATPRHAERSRVRVITKEVVEQCDHLIDLHGGDLDENLRPYSYWTVTGNQKQDQESRAMLLAFRPGSHHHLGQAEGSKASRFSREHRHDARERASFTAEAGRLGTGGGRRRRSAS